MRPGSCYSAFNAMVAAFPLDISISLSSPYVLEVYPHCWSLLEGRSSHPSACLIDIRPVQGRKLPRTLALHSFLTQLSILEHPQSFAPPRTHPH